MPETTLTAAEFHNLVHKQIVNAVVETLAQDKLDWELVRPFLDAARDICRGDFRDGGARIRIHTVRAEGDQWVEAEEAFLGISVADREDGEEWLSETFWISDLARADGDPERARAVVRGLERSIARISAWLAEREEGGPAEAEPPSGPA